MSDEEEFTIEKIFKDSKEFEMRPTKDFQDYKDYVQKNFPDVEIEDDRFMAFIIDVVLRRKKSLSRVSELDSGVTQAINSFEMKHIRPSINEMFKIPGKDILDEQFQSCITDKELAAKLLEIFRKGGFEALSSELIRIENEESQDKIIA